MSPIMSWINLIFFSSAITLVVLGFYQLLNCKIGFSSILCMIKAKIRQYRLRKCKYEIPSYPENDDYIEGSDGSDCEAPPYDKNRIVKYYEHALKQYNHLNDCDRLRRR